MKAGRHLLWIPAVLVAAGAVIFAVRPKPSTVALPAVRNVILISIDTLRADHLSCYGYERPTSPNIDAFASRGARFERAMSSSSWTVPAHMTMFTGVDPPMHGAEGYPRPQRATRRFPTLAEILSDRGFRTAAFTGGGYLAATFGFQRGFAKFSSQGRHFNANTASVRHWIESNRDEPFFMFLHGYDVHRPYKPPAQYAQMFEDRSEGRRSGNLVVGGPRPSDRSVRFAISQYDAEIRAVDDVIGGLLREWEEMGLLANTLVVITSDHGDEFYEHGQVYHSHSLYDELLHVPLIMVGPGVQAGVHRTQVGLIDIAPTILGVLGLTPMQKGMMGVDLTPVLTGYAEPPERLLFSFLQYSEVPYSIAAARSDEWKLIAWKVAALRDYTLKKTAKEYLHKLRLDRREDFAELFDLRSDPGETRDVGAEQPDARDRFAAILTRRQEEAERLNVADETESPVLREKDVEALKALGYL